MDIEVIIEDRKKSDEYENIIIDPLHENFFIKSDDESHQKIKMTDFLSSRLELMDEEYSSRDDRKSLILLSRQYPTYRHYSHRESKINQLRFHNKYHILPEIRGQNLFGIECEQNLKDNVQPNLKTSNFTMDTLHQLQTSILRYGSNGENFFVGFTGQKYQHKIVRPGFSARRYLANLARNLNETLVKRLMCEGYILEKNLFTNNSVMPHIRRRLSDDLSRYPEPYRILKQMLIAPGPLNEFSFIWGRKSILEDGMFNEKQEMGKGDIKILFKKNCDAGKDEFEEVQYAELSGHKKKTILSNLLMKSAMNHALKIKEQMMEYNDNSSMSMSRFNTSNVHIPVIKFDMKEAITELLTKETLKTLTTTQLEIPFVEECVNDKFRGRGLKGSRHRSMHPADTDGRIDESNEASVLETANRMSVLKEEIEADTYVPQNLTLRLNQTKPSKLKRKKKVLKSEPITGKESEMSDQNVSHILISPSEGGLQNLNGKVTDRESQGNAFVERIKRKAEIASQRKETVQPYGKYKDPGLSVMGDIDPTTSFSNWKYKEEHFPPLATGSSGYLTKTEASNVTNIQSKHEHSRLVNLLRGQADSVADEVLNRIEGGVDFAADVNVAIKSIVGQSRGSGDQIWNLEVDNIKNPADYQGVIRDIFKSIFKDKLDSLGGDDIEVSDSLMKLLQSGYNLKLEDIEMVADPVTGKMMAVLKNGIQIPEDIRKLIQSNTGYESSPFMKQRSTKTSMEQPSELTRNTDSVSLNETTNNRQYGVGIESVHSEVIKLELEPPNTVVWSPSGNMMTLPEFVQGNHLVEKDGLLFDSTGGHFDKQGQYRDKNGVLVPSMSMKLENVTMTAQLKDTAERNTKPREFVSVVSSDQKNIHGPNIISERNGLQGDDNSAIDSKIDNNNKLISSNQEDKSRHNNTDVMPQLLEIGTVKEDGIISDSIDRLPNNNDQVIESTKEQKESKILKDPTPSLSRSSMAKEKASEKQRKISTKEKKGKKKDFTFSQIDESKDIMKLYNRNEPSNVGSTKSKKSPDKKKKKKKVEVKDEVNDQDQDQDERHVRPEKEDSEDIYFINDSNEQIVLSGRDQTKTCMTDDYGTELASDEEIAGGDGDESRRLKMLKRQERLAQRKAEVQRMRKEEEMKKRQLEEDKRVEAQRLSLEDALRIKLDEERRRKEEEYRLQKEKEHEEEQALLDAERRKEFFRLRQIEKERQQREEYARRREEARIKEAIEERQRKEEQDKRDREEAAMLVKLSEEERNEYLRRKAELLEEERLEKEREKLLQEEQARLALEEAKLIAQKQAMEKRLLEERERLRIEDEGLKKYLHVTPAFVWSYFEFLNILGVNDDPPNIRFEATKQN